MNKKLGIIVNGLIRENPSLVLLLGMCPTLAVTTSVNNAIGMGLAATFVLIGSNVVISLLKKCIPDKIRIAAYIVIIAGFVTLVQMLLEAYVPALNKSLCVFIPLIVVNCIILAMAESFASKIQCWIHCLTALVWDWDLRLRLSWSLLCVKFWGTGRFAVSHCSGKVSRARQL